MKVIKFLETRVDITNINDMFCSDYNLMIINLLKKKFNNRCYKSVYILDILDIINRSSLNCKAKALDGFVYIDVQFKALCLLYEKGEIIHDCKIVQILSKNIILAKSAYCSIQIKNSTKVDIFKENDEIPIIVNTVRYNLFDTEVAISATPLIPIFRDPIVYVIDSNKNKEHEAESLYKENKDEINNLEKDISKFDKKAIKFFTDIMYPFKKYKSYKKNVDVLTLKDLDKIAEGDILYIGDRYLNEDIYYRGSKSFDISSLDLQDPLEILIPLHEMQNKLIFEYKKDLTTLLEFLQEYSIEKIKKNSILWQIYNSLKK
jgi:DNA-directed RNA polymerase subunit E'/Rpb7